MPLPVLTRAEVTGRPTNTHETVQNGGWSGRSPKRPAGPALGDGMVSVERLRALAPRPRSRAFKRGVRPATLEMGTEARPGEF
jgi:hypothetical protein